MKLLTNTRQEAIELHHPGSEAREYHATSCDTLSRGPQAGLLVSLGGRVLEPQRQQALPPPERCISVVVSSCVLSTLSLLSKGTLSIARSSNSPDVLRTPERRRRRPIRIASSRARRQMQTALPTAVHPAARPPAIVGTARACAPVIRTLDSRSQPRRARRDQHTVSVLRPIAAQP